MCAGVVLAPWPNRTEDGCFTWRGTKHLVPVNEPERSNANHGFVLDAAWDLVYYATDRDVLKNVVATLAEIMAAANETGELE